MIAELLGSALQGASSAAALQAIRLCWHAPLSTQAAVELTVLLKGWYFTHVGLHQAGIYHERLTRVKASVLHLASD